MYSCYVISQIRQNTAYFCPRGNISVREVMQWELEQWDMLRKTRKPDGMDRRPRSVQEEAEGHHP